MAITDKEKETRIVLKKAFDTLDTMGYLEVFNLLEYVKELEEKKFKENSKRLLQTLKK